MNKTINIYTNNNGNIEFKQAITEEIIKYNKFGLNDTDKIYLLTHNLLKCQCENVLLNMKVNQLERDLKELKEKR